MAICTAEDPVGMATDQLSRQKDRYSRGWMRLLVAAELSDGSADGEYR